MNVSWLVCLFSKVNMFSNFENDEVLRRYFASISTPRLIMDVVDNGILLLTA